MLEKQAVYTSVLQLRVERNQIKSKLKSLNQVERNPDFF